MQPGGGGTAANTPPPSPAAQQPDGGGSATHGSHSSSTAQQPDQGGDQSGGLLPLRQVAQAQVSGGCKSKSKTKTKTKTQTPMEVILDFAEQLPEKSLLRKYYWDDQVTSVFEGKKGPFTVKYLEKLCSQLRESCMKACIDACKEPVAQELKEVLAKKSPSKKSPSEKSNFWTHVMKKGLIETQPSQKAKSQDPKPTLTFREDFVQVPLTLAIVSPQGVYGCGKSTLFELMTGSQANQGQKSQRTMQTQSAQLDIVKCSTCHHECFKGQIVKTGHCPKCDCMTFDTIKRFQIRDTAGHDETMQQRMTTHQGLLADVVIFVVPANQILDTNYFKEVFLILGRNLGQRIVFIQTMTDVAGKAKAADQAGEIVGLLTEHELTAPVIPMHPVSSQANFDQLLEVVNHPLNPIQRPRLPIVIRQFTKTTKDPETGVETTTLKALGISNPTEEVHPGAQLTLMPLRKELPPIVKVTQDSLTLEGATNSSGCVGISFAREITLKNGFNLEGQKLVSDSRRCEVHKAGTQLPVKLHGKKKGKSKTNRIVVDGLDIQASYSKIDNCIVLASPCCIVDNFIIMYENDTCLGSCELVREEQMVSCESAHDAASSSTDLPQELVYSGPGYMVLLDKLKVLPPPKEIHYAAPMRHPEIRQHAFIGQETVRNLEKHNHFLKLVQLYKESGVIASKNDNGALILKPKKGNVNLQTAQEQFNGFKEKEIKCWKCGALDTSCIKVQRKSMIKCYHCGAIVDEK